MNETSCRICLNDNEIESLHIKQELDNEVKTTAAIIQEISHIKVLENDSLPQFICTDCKNEVIRSYNFKQLIVESDIYLKKLLQDSLETEQELNHQEQELNHQEQELNHQEQELNHEEQELNCQEQEVTEYIYDDPDQDNVSENMSIKEEERYTEGLTIEGQYEVQERQEIMEEHQISVYRIAKRHSRKKQPTGSYSCSTCERSFNLREDLLVHLSKKVMGLCAKTPNELGKKCFLCELIFDTVKLKQKHIKSSHSSEDVLWKCLECDFESKSAFSFEKHTMHHQTGFDYYCGLCPGFRYFATRSKLKFHMEGYHNKRPESQKFTCDICGNKLKCKQYLLKHIKAVHFGEKKYKCPAAECDVGYASQSAIGQHMYTVHGVEPPIRCADCFQGFTFQSEIRFHNCVTDGSKVKKTCQRRNMGADPYCNICQREFRSMSTYYRHHDVQHKNIKKFTCDYCPKTFGLKTGKLIHERTHTREKPFQCTSGCGAAFSDPSTLYKHIRAKHPESLTELCPACPENKFFPDKITLRNHLRLIHPDEWRIFKVDFEKDLKLDKKIKKYDI